MPTTQEAESTERPLEEKLAEYLRQVTPGAGALTVSDLRPISGGLSQEMFFFTVDGLDGPTGGRMQYVLRRDPPPGEGVLETDRLIEAAVLRLVHEAGLPVPAVPWAERDNRWLDRPFLIMERLPGEMMRDLRPEEAGSPRAQTIGRQMAEILGRLHALDPAEIQRRTGLTEPGPGSAAAVAQLDRHEKVLRQDMLEPQPVLTDVLLWLRRRAPLADRTVVVHADYRLSNLLLDGDRVTGVLDWELVHLGDPMEDLGRLISRNRPLVSGLLPREEFIAIYERISGIRVDLDACYFWEVVARLRATITMLTGVKAYVQGGYRQLHLGFMGLSHANRLYDLLALLD